MLMKESRTMRMQQHDSGDRMPALLSAGAAA
jgi:hypothetical protein